jgi:hypothetical protein
MTLTGIKPVSDTTISWCPPNPIRGLI